jgi:hypothetical protein
MKRRQEELKKAALQPSPCEDEQLDGSEAEISDTELDSLIHENNRKLLKWEESAGSYLRKAYTGGSRSSMKRKRRAERECAQIAETCKPITTFFASVVPRQYKEPEPYSDCGEERDEADCNMKKMLFLLQEKLSVLRNERKCQCLSLSTFDYFRMQCLALYFTYVLNGEGKVESSSRTVLSVLGKQKNRGNEWAARCLRKWADYFLLHGRLPPRFQGKHVKHTSLLTNEDIKWACLKWLRNAKFEDRKVLLLQAFLRDKVIPQHLNINNHCVPESTIIRYMRKWGYTFRRDGQDVYYDGHEREDVVAYRQIFVAKMIQYARFMKSFEPENEESVIQPILDPLIESTEHVLVTHDETYFYAFDGQSNAWLMEGETRIRKKGQGQALMVSDFMCPCHGALRISDDESKRLNLPIRARVIINPGASRDGWWKSDDMVNQLVQKAIPLFEHLHPNCKGIFCFDQSSNHNAYASDTLIPTKLNLSGKGKQRKCHATWFIQDGLKISQDMQDENGEPKGLRSILQERNLWINGLRLTCTKKQSKEEENSDSDCDYNEAEAPPTLSGIDSFPVCCARHRIASQPDFLAEKTRLQQVVEATGKHEFLLYPKFHCECNFIERVWGEAKREARAGCDYKFTSLKKRVPEILDNIPIKHVRAYFRKAFRYISAYSLGYSGSDAFKIVKKYKSHRRVPALLDEEVVAFLNRK